MTEQLSMFSELETLLSPERQKFRRALRRGSGFEGGKDRIKEKAATLNKKDFVEFLKKEYGVGGCSFENGWMGTTSMWFDLYEKNWAARVQYSWTTVADEILDMIHTNCY